MSTLTSDLQKFGAQFTGRLLSPDHADYETARRIHNGFVDRRPALIAQCRGAADIADALAFAEAHGLDVAVRGGGHNVAGHACVDAGVMIDLSAMRSVRVDPTSRVAVVDGGVTWREFNRETQLFGLGATGGVISSTGVAGLTLGGGFGWLMPKHGMALSLIYLVVFDIALGLLPASINHISITRQVRLLTFDVTEGIATPAITLVAITGMWLALALWRIRRLES